MKNRILILFALIVAAAAAGGQSLPYATVLLETNPLANGGGNIRSWTPTKAVIYYECPNGSSSTGFFAIIENGVATMQSLKCPPGFHACDFKILGDTLYFGGEVSGQSVLGFFDIGEMEAGRQPQITAFSCTAIHRINRLVAYRYNEGNEVGVAAIGMTKVPMPTFTFLRYYAVELKSANLNPTCQYLQTYNDVSQLKSEAFTDVVVTDNYVAFVGDVDGGDVWIRRGDRNDFMGDPGFNTRYIYSRTPYIPNSKLVAAEMENDDIAVSCTINDGTQNSAAVWMYHLTTMDNYEAQRIPCGQKDNCVEMEYMKSDHTLLLLMETYDAAITQLTCRVLCVKPGVATPYTATAIAPASHFTMTSLSVHDQHFFLTGAAPYWMLNDRQVFSPSNTCVDESSYQALDMRLYQKNNWQQIRSPMQMSMIPIVLSPMTESYQAICIHQQ